MSTLPYASFSTEPAPSRGTWARPGRGAAGTDRVRSLDVFRGITMAGMILVNNAGDGSHVYTPLEHSKWDGCTPTDLVFPFFLFIVGVAIPYSLVSRRRKLAEAGLDGREQRSAIVLNVLRRSAILFALGLLLYGFPINLHRPPGGGASGMGILDPATLRIPGVLQRIAICYAAAAVMAEFMAWRSRAVVATALLIVYTLLLRLVPVPGHGAGVLTADGSLASYLDRLLLGHHTYKPNYDPEGLLSTMPAIVTAMIGTFAGEWLRRSRPAVEKACGLFAGGVALALLGYVTNGLLLPINKALWTPSYVLLAGGLALLGFGFCYWLIDVHGYERWAGPFKVMGMNAIAVYVLSGLLGRLTLLIKVARGGADPPAYLKTWLYEHTFAALTRAPLNGSPYVASMLWGSAYVLLFLGVAAILYRRRWFFKV